MQASGAQPSPVMTGGAGPTSYNENSSAQGGAFALLGGPILKRALGHWLQLRRASPETKECPVCIADLGSATGKNAVAQMGLVLACLASAGGSEKEVVGSSEGVKWPQEEGGALFAAGQQLGAATTAGDSQATPTHKIEPGLEKEISTGRPSAPQGGPRRHTEAAGSDGAFDPRSVMAFFSDLPDNDWGTLLQRIHTDSRGSSAGGIPRLPCHVAAVPGSFYERLFPDGFLDIAMSNSSLHWLSRLPPESEALGWNPGRVWCTQEAPEHVREAYRRQHAADLRTFLKLRAAELRSGGLLWVLMPATEESGGPSTTFARILEESWRELVQEGVLESDLLDSFNVQVYFPTLSDVREAVSESGAYDIHTLECVRSERGPARTGETPFDKAVQGPPRRPPVTVAQVWAVLQPQVTGHMGAERSNRLYQRMCENWARDPEKYQPGGGAVLCAALFRK